MALITTQLPALGYPSAYRREFQSPRARPRLRAGEADPQGCSVRKHTEGGHEPMITSVPSPSVMQSPR